MIHYSYRQTKNTLKGVKDMKFYYNGQKIRESKTRHYTHACVKANELGGYWCYGCSTTRQGAEKTKTDAIRENEKEIASCERYIKAIVDGKNYVTDKYCGKVYLKEIFCFKGLELPEIEKKCYTLIDNAKARIADIQETWKIVEVEGRI